MMMDPAKYESWYQTPRGSWISQAEFRLMTRQLQPQSGSTLLDVGCGTGHFTRQFAALGLTTTGVDPDTRAIRFARHQSRTVTYLGGSGVSLPFRDASFDYCIAITSLCFISEFEASIAEMWRVSRKAIVLGLLNRKSLLYKQKFGCGEYLGARWDTYKEISLVTRNLDPKFITMHHGTAVFLPYRGVLPSFVEAVLPSSLPFGGFLSICLSK